MHTRRVNHVVVYSLIVVLLASLLTGCFGEKGVQPAPQSGGRDVIATQGVVTTAHPLASQAGLDVLRKGGNAIDAAIATALVLGVVEPYASGLGGGGMAIVYIARENKCYIVDFQDAGPGKCRPDSYKAVQGKVPEFKQIGYKSVAVPGELRGLEMLHKKFATMKWADLVTPAIRYAEDGIPAGKTLTEVVTEDMLRIDKYPADSKAWFMRQFYREGLPIQPGDKLANRELAETLRKVAAGGADVFYTGEVAAAIAREFAKPGAGGWITKEDLARYKAVMREPLRGNYRGYDIFGFPPPGSGLVVMEMLNLLEGYDVARLGPADEFYHIFIEAQKLAYADRTRYGGDTDFVDVPVGKLLDKNYAAELRKRIDPNKASEKKPQKKGGQESGSTTSFAVVDKEGNMVGMTKTLGHFMGAGVVVGGTGIMLNDHMDTFSANPKSRNAPAPDKRVFSAISSTLVVKDGKPFLAIGSPGASRIISTVAEIIVNVIDFRMDLQQAINAARVHNRNEAVTSVEGGMPPAVRAKLEARGHKLQVLRDIDLFFGGAQGLMIRPDGKIHGAADPRRDGIAVGF